MGVTTKKRIVILASGRGSNFVALTTAIQKGVIPNAEVVALISNKKSAPALGHASELGIPTHVVESRKYRKNGVFHRHEYEKELLQVLEPLRADWICLAGYLLLLGSEFVRAFPQRMINIHPSLLPAFKGLHATAQALQAGVRETGCTVHLVTEGLDDGPIILQNKISIRPGDTDETLSARLLPLEHQTYIEALRKLCTQAFEVGPTHVHFKA